MSTTLKDKLYDYESIPPQGVWESIAAALDEDLNEEEEEEKPETPVIPIAPKRFNYKFLAVAASAVAIIVTCFLIFRTNKTTTNEIMVYINDTTLIPVNGSYSHKRTAANGGVQTDAILQVPQDDDSTGLKTQLAQNEPNESGPSEKTTDNTPDDTKTKGADSKMPDAKPIKNHTYITITGPAGQPVKISSKAAALLTPTDDSSTTKWTKKVKDWKNAMQANTLAATPGNFLDIVELTNTLTDN